MNNSFLAYSFNDIFEPGKPTGYNRRGISTFFKITQKDRRNMKGLMNYSLILLTAFLVVSCGNEKKNITSGTPGETAGLTTEATNVKVEEWVKKGVECYGIVILNYQDGSTTGRVVKSKVMAVREDRVKMKAIESISFSDAVGCDKLGISFGETWWETEGDIFKTQENAQAYLVKRNWATN